MRPAGLRPGGGSGFLMETSRARTLLRTFRGPGGVSLNAPAGANPRPDVNHHSTMARREEAEASGLRNLLAANASERPTAPALLAPDRAPMRYAALREFVERTAARLSEAGIQGDARVLVLVPSGPELVTCLLAASLVAVAVPVGASATISTIRSAASRVRPRLILASGSRGREAQALADAAGIPVWVLEPGGPEAPAGWFRFVGDPHFAGLSAGRPTASVAVHGDSDPAVILPTGGTTGEPKLIPLSVGNLLASAAAAARALELGPTDRCLPLAPLDSAFGWVGGWLATMAVGAACLCPAESPTGEIEDWLRTWDPTWILATAGMLERLLHSSGPNPVMHAPAVDAAGRRLRFILSSASPLHERWRNGIESRFRVPVLEAYGVTEAAHYVCSQALPPRARRPGSVGVPVHASVRLVDSRGAPVRTGEVGEIEIRGPGVSRYRPVAAEGGEDASRTESEGDAGWRPTGDLGRMDIDGDLYLVDRMAETIQRGEERVLPRDIERHLTEHPEVARSVVFPVPHAQLGQEVAALVTPCRGGAPSEEDLRNHLFEASARIRIPARILVVPELPRGPGGRIRRRELADHVASLLEGSFEPPSGATEESVARVFGEVLNRPRVGRREHFLVLGGDSLGAVQVAVRLAREHDVSLSRAVVFLNPTVEQLGRELDRRKDERDRDALAARLGGLSNDELDRLFG